MTQTTLRKIITIDEEKCDGCGQCADACAEGAIKIVDGKARLVSETYCDGLGACIGECPRDAITIVEREAVPFDEKATGEHLARIGRPAHTAPKPKPAPAHNHPHAGGCPGSRMLQFDADTMRAPVASAAQSTAAPAQSQLRQWPVQLTLVPTNAPYFRNADLLLVADCVPFAVPDFHDRYMKDHAVALGCPKLDDAQFYVEKLTAIITDSNVRSIKVLVMEVPCCSGLLHVAREAVAASGKAIPVEEVVVKIRG